MQEKISAIYGCGAGRNLKGKDNYLPGYCVMLCESSVIVELVMPWTRSTLQTLGNQRFFLLTSAF